MLCKLNHFDKNNFIVIHTQLLGLSNYSKIVHLRLASFLSNCIYVTNKIYNLFDTSCFPLVSRKGRGEGREIAIRNKPF